MIQDIITAIIVIVALAAVGYNHFKKKGNDNGTTSCCDNCAGCALKKPGHHQNDQVCNKL